MELMIAIPAAAAAPLKNAVGKLQNSGDADMTPNVASVSAASAAAG
jgi:hypothetical protein